MDKITLYTIGFTKKSADLFFSTLMRYKVKGIIDIRLKNDSQLAGYTKKDDLRFFLQKICGCGYEHRPEWAPTERILSDYKNKTIDWNQYEVLFNNIIKNRRIETNTTTSNLEQKCLLCSEPTADQCHRRLVAEYLRETIPNITIRHI